MKVAIHQPTYIPYLGFFAKILVADVYIVFDTAQYEKRSVHNRQYIRTSEGSQLLSIPLSTSFTSFIETPICYGTHKPEWYQSHWHALEFNYKKTPFFNIYRETLKYLYSHDHPLTLGEFNLSLIKFMLNSFGIQKTVFLFSELDINPSLSASEKLALAVKRVNGTEYISGPSGKKYMSLDPFIEKGIDVTFFEYKHPVYTQYHTRYDKKFIPYISGLDALFNLGSLP